MNLDDLRPQWQAQQAEMGNQPPAGGARTAEHLHAQAAKFERDIFRRDVVETLAGIFVLVFFSVAIGSIDEWLIRAGLIVIIIGTIEIIAVMHLTRRSQAIPRPDLPVSEFCAQQLRRIQSQITLLRWVWLWYIGPILLGCYLMLLAIVIKLWEMMTPYMAGILFVIGAMFGLFGFLVDRINQRAVRKNLIPLRDEFAALCAESVPADASEVDGPE